MSVQTYGGSCPADSGDGEGYQITVTVAHRDEQCPLPATMAVGCPRALREGEHCPQGGMHECRPVEHATGDEIATTTGAGPDDGLHVGWTQSPTDGTWHAVALSRESYRCPECGMTSHNPDDAHYLYCGNCHEFQGVAAACGHRMPAVLVEARPGTPGCMDCMAKLGGGMLGPGEGGWSL